MCRCAPRPRARARGRTERARGPLNHLYKAVRNRARLRTPSASARLGSYPVARLGVSFGPGRHRRPTPGAGSVTCVAQPQVAQRHVNRAPTENTGSLSASAAVGLPAPAPLKATREDGSKFRSRASLCRRAGIRVPSGQGRNPRSVRPQGPWPRSNQSLRPTFDRWSPSLLRGRRVVPIAPRVWRSASRSRHLARHDATQGPAVPPGLIPSSGTERAAARRNGGGGGGGKGEHSKPISFS